ncbi:hypothetical protein pb186bvf_000872 [Paramecium bursaria]
MAQDKTYLIGDLMSYNFVIPSEIGNIVLIQQKTEGFALYFRKYLFFEMASSTLRKLKLITQGKQKFLSQVQEESFKITLSNADIIKRKIGQNLFSREQERLSGIYNQLLLIGTVQDKIYKYHKGKSQKHRIIIIYSAEFKNIYYLNINYQIKYNYK